MLALVFTVTTHNSGIKYENDTIPHIVHRNRKFEVISKRSVNFDNVLFHYLNGHML